MKRTLVKAGTLLVLSLSHSSFAGSTGLFFNIVANGSGLVINTTIPNHSYPAAGIKLNSPGASITGGCTPASNGYCLFSVSDTTAANISVSGASGTLSATLCLNGNGPLSCQNYNVSVPPANASFVYTGTISDNPVAQCSINASTGAIGSCGTTGSTFNEPTGIVFNQAGTLAYVSSFDGPQISMCNVIASTGTLMNCGLAADTYPESEAIALNPAGTYIYTTNYNSGDAGEVSVCNVNPVSGAVSGCTIAASGFPDEIQGIAINPAGTYAYVGTFIDNTTIYKCAIDPGNGTLTGCGPTGNGFYGPTDVAFNPTGTMAYVTNLDNSTISQCNVVSSSGALTGCVANVDSGLDDPISIVVNKAGTFAYVADYAGKLSYCTINNAGTLTSCTLSTAYSGTQPTGIALYY